MFDIHSITFYKFQTTAHLEGENYSDLLSDLSNNLVIPANSRFDRLYVLHIAKIFRKDIACNIIKVA